MKRIGIILCAGLLLMGTLASVTSGEEKSKSNNWSFEDTEVGAIPTDWVIADTNGKDTLATWKVAEMEGAPDGKKVFMLSETKNTKRTYNLAIAQKTNYKDVDIKLMVKSMIGEEDQGGGPIWRAKDKDNYYIARWNPLEKNYRVYFVVESKRKQIATVDVETDDSKWHEIGITMAGNKITASFDGKKMMEVEDSTLPDAGMVGLWTKADAATAFDKFNVQAIEK